MRIVRDQEHVKISTKIYQESLYIISIHEFRRPKLEWELALCKFHHYILTHFDMDVNLICVMPQVHMQDINQLNQTKNWNHTNDKDMAMACCTNNTYTTSFMSSIIKHTQDNIAINLNKVAWVEDIPCDKPPWWTYERVKPHYYGNQVLIHDYIILKTLHKGRTVGKSSSSQFIVRTWQYSQLERKLIQEVEQLEDTILQLVKMTTMFFNME